jgi:hypothetical protein
MIEARSRARVGKRAAFGGHERFGRAIFLDLQGLPNQSDSDIFDKIYLIII